MKYVYLVVEGKDKIYVAACTNMDAAVATVKNRFKRKKYGVAEDNMAKFEARAIKLKKVKEKKMISVFGERQYGENIYPCRLCIVKLPINNTGESL